MTVKNWTKSESTTTLDGFDGEFVEYTNASNPNISIFVDEEIDTDL